MISLRLWVLRCRSPRACDLRASSAGRWPSLDIIVVSASPVDVTYRMAPSATKAVPAIFVMRARARPGPFPGGNEAMFVTLERLTELLDDIARGRRKAAPVRQLAEETQQPTTLVQLRALERGL